MEPFHVKHYLPGMCRFEVQLVRQDSDRWQARLTDGTIILDRCREPRGAVARELLLRGADPRCELSIHRDGRLIAFDLLGPAAGSRQDCGDVGVIERG